MSRLDYFLRDFNNCVEFLFNFGVIICGLYVLWVLFSALTK